MMVSDVFPQQTGNADANLCFSQTDSTDAQYSSSLCGCILRVPVLAPQWQGNHIAAAALRVFAHRLTLYNTV